MKPIQIHIDLETMGIRPTSQILSIGACCNDKQFYRELELHDDYVAVFTRDQSTADWWVRQGGFQPTVEVVSPHKALVSLGHWITELVEDGSDYEIWANSPSFDCAILRNHFTHYALHCPWEFWHERDVRTIKNAARTLRINLHEKKNPHNALQDALNQQALVDRFYSAVADYVDTARQSQLAGETNAEEVCVELHSTDRV